MIPFRPQHPDGYNPNDVLQKVRRTISEFDMITPHERVLVAVSGGIDSVALLHILLELAPTFSFRLGVAHFNHGLRGEDADKDAEFVASLAGRLQLPFHADKRDTRSDQKRHRLSLEEAARKLRYAFFTKVREAHGYTKVALGHQADDNAEQILMQLIRGAGMSSMAGIPPIRDATIIRPLIRLTRQQIHYYCRSAGISFVADKTNFDRRHLRNRIRHDLIPLLRRDYNPEVVRSVNRLSDIVRDELRWTEDICETQFRLAITGMKPDLLRFSINELRNSVPALRRRIIRKAVGLVKGDLRHVGFAHIDAVMQLIAVDSEDGRVHLPGRIEVKTAGNELIVKKHETGLRRSGRPIAALHRFRYIIELPVTVPLTVVVPESGVRVIFSRFTTDSPEQLRGAGQQQAFFDMDKLHFPLVLRNIRPGDRFSPLGAGGTQKVKKYFIDHKVPAEKRARCPLLVSGRQIAWVVGHRIAESAKVTASTTQVLKAEVQVVTQ